MMSAPLSASVIYNRLANPDAFPYLQIDATVQYIVGRAPTADDLQIDDPYNTYLYQGLPPGADLQSRHCVFGGSVVS